MMRGVSYLFLLMCVGFSRLPGAFELHSGNCFPIPICDGLNIGLPLLHDMISSAILQKKSSSSRVNTEYGNQFGLKEMTRYSVHGVWQLRSWQMGLGGSTFGSPLLYREQVVEAAVVFMLNNKLTIGGGLGRYELGIQNYGSAVSYGGHAAWVFQLDNNLVWSTYLHNIVIIGSSDLRTELPRVVSTGIATLVGENLIARVQWEQDLIYSGRLSFGTVWRIRPWFSVLAGYIGQPSQVQVGIGISILKINIGYVAVTHQQLGLSQTVGVSISLGR